MTTPIPSTFQPSYRVSRERLLEQAHRLSGRLDVHVDSRAIDPRGPDGETLALDFVVFGARRPRHAVVVSSGTHGVEGYTGSAIQHWALQQLLPALTLAPDTALILQHANNPYGFAWHRRVNENNVDLNRNFHQQFDPTLCSADYESLYEAINPADLDPANEARRQQQLAAFIATHGMRRYQTMLTEGQYKFPRGLQFGGQALQASSQHLLALARDYLSQAQSVVWLDIHTGLGESGACELITGAAPDHRAYQFGNRVFGGQVKSASSGESLSAPLKGMMDAALCDALTGVADFCCVSPEYGTHPMPKVLGALRADNWLQHYGDRQDATGQSIKRDIVEAFKPASAAWEQAILASGASLLTQALRQLPGATMNTAA